MNKNKNETRAQFLKNKRINLFYINIAFRGKNGMLFGK